MRRIVFLGLCVLSGSFLHGQAVSHFGARAMGMGGAHVAVADDLTGVYWNPAGLALGAPREFAIVVSGEGADERNSIEKIKRLVDLSEAAEGTIITPEDISAAIELLEGLAEPGSGASGEANLDFMFRYQGFAFSVLGLGTASASPLIDLDILNFDPNSGEPLPTDLPKLELNGLLTRQFVATYCREVVPDSVWVGGNVKYIRADSYYAVRLIVDTENHQINISDLVDEATHENKRTSSAWGVDLGVMALLTQNLRLGVVARDINSPEFKHTGPVPVQLNPQYRVGLSYQFAPSFLLAADYDLSKNSEGILGVAEREISLGGEGRLFNRALAFRGGVSRNIDIEKSKWQFSAGIGLNLTRVSIDLGASADSGFDQAAIAISGSVRY